jgi:hypothetical protein
MRAIRPRQGGGTRWHEQQWYSGIVIFHERYRAMIHRQRPEIAVTLAFSSEMD